jgi:hypothetical protein
MAKPAHRWTPWIAIATGTVVVRPTAGARAYVQAWITAAAELPWGDVCQTAQMFAIAPSRPAPIIPMPFDPALMYRRGCKTSRYLLCERVQCKSGRRALPGDRLIRAPGPFASG